MRLIRALCPFVVLTLRSVNHLLHHHFTQCVSLPYSKFDTLLSIYIMYSCYNLLKYGTAQFNLSTRVHYLASNTTFLVSVWS